jgi:lysophospholipase L1-like esterase
MIAAGFTEETSQPETDYNATQTAADITHAATIVGVIADTAANATITRIPVGLPIGAERRVLRRGANDADVYIGTGLIEVIDGSPDGGIRINAHGGVVLIKKKTATVWETIEATQASGETPLSPATDAVGEQFIGSGAGPAATASSGGVNNSYVINTPATVAGKFDRAEISLAAAGAVTYFVASSSSAGVFTLLRSVTVSGLAGINTHDLDLDVNVGDYVGFRSTAAVHLQTGPQSIYALSGALVGANATLTLSGATQLQFRARIGGEALAKGRIAYSVAKRLDGALAGVVQADAATGDKIVEGAGSISPSVYRNTAFTAGVVYTITVLAKASERSKLNVFANVVATPALNVTFDLLTGVALGGTAAAVASMAYVGGGWWSCRIAFTPTATGSANLQLRTFAVSGAHPYTGDGVSGLFVSSISILPAGGADLYAGIGAAFATTAWVKAGCTVTADVAGAFPSLSAVVAEGARAAFLGASAGSGNSSFVGKWAALGTSITQRNLYTSVLAAMLPGMVLTNLGVSGASLGAGGNSHDGTLVITNQISSIPSDAKLVTLEAGTNDFGAALVALGVLGDTTTATFYGALFNAATAIRAQAPNALIVFLTPYSSDSRFAAHSHTFVRSDGAQLRQFQQAVVDVARYTGWPVVDVGREAGINSFTAGSLTSDGLHINAGGGQRFARFVHGALMNLELLP